MQQQRTYQHSRADLSHMQEEIRDIRAQMVELQKLAIDAVAGSRRRPEDENGEGAAEEEWALDPVYVDNDLVRTLK